MPDLKHAKLISILFFALALLTACWFRFSQLGLKPFHHDEGVNAHFLMPLMKQGSVAYKYNPLNYHGPTLYYITWTAVKLFGETDFALRFWQCAFGVLLVVLLWWFRDHLGDVGLPVAAFAIAVSPALVFFSRYFIHEMMFGFCSLAMAVAAWRYARSKHFGWMILLSVSTAWLFATKETALITAFTMLFALLLASLWDVSRKLIQEKRWTPAALITTLRSDWAEVRPSMDHALSGFIIFVFVFVFFYSSAFTNWPGVADAFKSIAHWTEERSGNDHVHARRYYLGILFKYDLPLLIGGLLAGLLIVWRGTRFWLFVGAWTFGLTLAYSLIPYKTPWLMVSFLVPLCLVCGYAAEQIYQLLARLPLRILWLGLLGVALLGAWRLCAEVNFDKYADNGNSAGYFREYLKGKGYIPYLDGQYGFVYAQTDKDFHNFVQTLQRTADSYPEQKATGIYLASNEYWPLPWYMRNYSGVAFTGSLPAKLDEASVTQPLMIAKTDQRDAIEEAGGWRMVDRPFVMRPGVELLIYQREKK